MSPQKNLRRKTIPAAIAAALTAVALSGCIVDVEPFASIYVKDDITDDYAEVHVTYTSVAALPEGASAWVVVYEGERTIELLALNASTAREKLADLQIAPGPYEGLRIAVSAVEAVDHNGTSHALTVVGDYLQIAEEFEIREDRFLSLLVDYDLDRSVDATNLTFAAEALSFKRSDRDSNGNGISDFDDPDENGTKPEQSRHGYFGLCTAWFASETGREHGNASNSSAFQHLQQQAADANQTVDEYCDAQEFPGPPDHVPERAREARQAAMERRDAARGNASQERGPPEDAGAGNGTGRPDGAGRPDGIGRQ